MAQMERYNLSIPAPLRKRYQALSEKTGRPLGELIRDVLTRFIEQKEAEPAK